MLSKILIGLSSVLSLGTLGLLLILFTAASGSDPVAHAIFGMAICLYALWITPLSAASLFLARRARGYVQKITLPWQVTFTLFSVILALAEEVVTTLMSLTAPLYGLRIGQAYITVSANYFDVVFGHSVIVFAPMFITWAWLLSKYRFEPHEVFLLFGLSGAIAESLAGGLQQFLALGMWVFVYGLMIYLPSYAAYGHASKPVRWYHYIVAIVLPLLASMLVAVSIAPLIHQLFFSSVEHFPPLH